MSFEASLDDALALLASYGCQGARVEPVAIGLINRTFRVEGPDARRTILQKLNPIFTPRVHEDIEAVTAHLARKGMVTPRLVRTIAGELYVEGERGVWRMMTFIDGDTKERLKTVAEAREAGVLLARFHRAVADLEHEFKNRRLGVHDTPRHLAKLRQALEEHRDKHPRYAEVAPLGEEILALAGVLPPLPPVADRIVHGDPKVSNLLFEAATGRGVALVDLDTLARMPLFVELGDAFRSWCNPSGEDATRVQFSLELFGAAIAGYAEGAEGLIEADEVRGIVPATKTIIVELAARFAADALEESYFGWDATRFPTRGAHNELRARGQLALARSLMAQEAQAEAIVHEAFARRPA